MSSVQVGERQPLGSSEARCCGLWRTQGTLSWLVAAFVLGLWLSSGSMTHAAQEPAVEAPQQETPATETPATETPATETPATETPATETPVTETPATETPEQESTTDSTPAAVAPQGPRNVLPHPFDQLFLSPPKYDVTPYSVVEEEAARKEFEQQTARLREVLKRLFDVKSEFIFAADRETLARTQSEWAELKIEGEVIFMRLQDLAARLFVTDPNKEGMMFRMLIGSILEDAFQGRMWTCYRNIVLARRTVGLDKSMDPIAALAAFRCCQFEEFANYIAFSDPTTLDDKHREALAIFDYAVQAWQIELPIREAEALADDLPRVRMKTTLGVVELELFENEAPNTVANFISLIEKGFYKDILFHRVIPGFMAQAGESADPTQPGYTIPCECYRENHRRHFMGSLAMALAGRDTGSSQFYIAFGPQPHLDGKHTVFGRVISGMEVVERLAQINPEELKGNEIPDVILEMEVIRKRDHEYVPEVNPAR